MPTAHGDDSRATHRRGDSRRHRDRRSRSPDRRQHPRSEERDHRDSEERDFKSDKERSSRRYRSPHGHHDRRRRERDSPMTAPVELPFGARQLGKGDLRKFEPLLAHYLDLQKQKYIEDMDDREVKGRWKSFVGKWNRGELAEGWYDPDMFARIVASHPEAESERAGYREMERQESRHASEERQLQHHEKSMASGEEDDSDYGPALPSSSRGGRRMGAGVPSRDDLAVRDEMRSEDRDVAREELRAERRADRKLQKERLDELVPRAEAGTRERKLEKKQEVNAKMKQFREGSPGSMAAANDNELMGGGDSLGELKQRKVEEQRRKTEREIRREELQRAKQEEIEEKRRKWQEREQGTMSMLQELARQRFGSGN
ncbi:hypothetical protein PWT90_02794 [Aphanocladium album]|nr:hypothetical protein PWT90_02794 [Aphanocladium album]